MWEYPPVLVGGLGTYAENITRKFVQLGHDVSVFTLNPGGLPVREMIAGVEVHRPLIADATKIFSALAAEDIKKWGAGLKLFSDIFVYNILSATKLLHELIAKERYHFDIIAFHDWLSSIGGIIAKDNSNMPAVFHVHSTEWGRTKGAGSPAISRLEEGVARTADLIVTVSEVMKEDLAFHGWPQDKINVVWNGVNPEKYDPGRHGNKEAAALREAYQVADDESMLLFIGRLTPVKGVSNLVQAMPTVLKEYPKTKLVILGRGEEQRDLPNLVARLDVSKNVRYHFEFVSEEERIRHYAAADVCVFPSTYEPFGIVSLEAMSMGKPLVVGARGTVGFREQVVPAGPDQCGIHVNGAEPADIAWGLKEVLRNPEQARQWGKNGRARVLKLFTWDQAAAQTLKLYRGLLERTNSASTATP